MACRTFAHLAAWLAGRSPVLSTKLAGSHLCRLTFLAREVARRYLNWVKELTLSLDTRHFTLLVTNLSRYRMDITGWCFPAATTQLSDKRYAAEQFCRFLPAGMLRLRQILPTTTDRHTCSPGTNRRNCQGRRRTSRPSLVVVATTTLLKFTRRTGTVTPVAVKQTDRHHHRHRFFVRFVVIAASARRSAAGICAACF